MARKVTYFSKKKDIAIQGVCQATKLGVCLGQPCDGSVVHGGGRVADMEIAGQCIVIRKTTMDGKPMRNYGQVAPANQPNQTYQIEGDGVMFPLVHVNSVVFADEDDKPAQQGQAKGK